MGQEMRFDKSALYGEDFVHCSCGFLQFLGFHCRISKTLDPGSYELDTPEDTISLLDKEKAEISKPNSHKSNINAWIKRRINRKQSKKPKRYPGTSTTHLSRTSSIHRSKFNRTGESIKELGRTLLDGILHRIPYGQKVPEEMIKGKLSRSLSADYDAYTKREKKKSGISVNSNHESNKFRRIYSSPATVSEKKSTVAINVKREEEKLLNCNREKDAKFDDILEFVQNKNGVDEGMLLTREHGENIDCALLGSKDEEQRRETMENGGVPSETRDADPVESTVSQVDFAQKDLCVDSKELESLTNLLKQMGFDVSSGIDEETVQSKPEGDDDEMQILDSEVTLEEFKRAWDQINKVEFAKFDCNLLPQDLILVLDLIDQAYKEAYSNCSSTKVCFSSYLSKENIVLKEVQERVTWYLKAQEECSDEADELIALDFERYDGWFDYRTDFFEKILIELERFILDDLVESLLSN